MAEKIAIPCFYISTFCSLNNVQNIYRILLIYERNVHCAKKNTVIYQLMAEKIAISCFYIITFCSLNNRPVYKIFIEYCPYMREMCTEKLVIYLKRWLRNLLPCFYISIFICKAFIYDYIYNLC